MLLAVQREAFESLVFLSLVLRIKVYGPSLVAQNAMIWLNWGLRQRTLQAVIHVEVVLDLPPMVKVFL